MADPRSQQATLVGDELQGNGKWHGGVLAADGNIYGIPFNATQVLRFDPRSQQATFVGAELPGGNKWSGGVLAADGNIYGIPSDATQVLRFDPRTQQATLVGAPSCRAAASGVAACWRPMATSTASRTAPRRCCASTRARSRRRTAK
jgi:hypothetical protein